LQIIKKNGLLLLLLSLLFLDACKVTKPLSDSEYLLIKNKFLISTRKISSDELSGYIQQEPNSKLLGLFRPNIAFYNMGNKGKETKFKKWLRTKVGSAPVILDSSLNTIALKQMGLYLNNKGYFNSILEDSIVRKKKKAVVYYIIKASQPYLIQEITYSIADTQLASFVYEDSAKSLIRAGNPYDAYLLDNERTRITNHLQNFGYYRFNNGFIIYHIDSLLGSRQMKLKIEITNPVIPSIENFDAFQEIDHKRYRINRIFIYPGYDPLQKEEVKYDTTIKGYQAYRKDTTIYYYSFLTSGKLKIKPRTIVQSLFLKTGDYYSLNEVKKTYTNLGRLPVFRYKNILFTDPAEMPAGQKDLLDCKIQLAREQTKSFSVSTDGTNSAGAFGVQGNLIYQNRNIFRGAQFFTVNFSASAMTQGSANTDEKNQFFNTFELGINTSLTFPQFLFPVKQETLPKRYRPKTSINLGYNYQKQADYYRNISNASFGYSWNQTDKINHVVNPIELSYVKVYPDSTFLAWLNSLTDQSLINQYTNHMVAGLRYTITYNSQDRSKVEDFLYIRANFQTGGNLLYVLNSTFGGAKVGSSYALFGVPYSQFVRPDLDLRYYIMFTKSKTLVLRFYGGIGIPYGNSNSLPFEKAFFAGGANDIRGWRMGSLGPGSYFNDTVSNTYNQIGDMQLQGNFEYRFPISGIFKGAVFMDCGNIWLLQPSADFPGGDFNFNTFLPQIAVDAGFGIRLDFDFFVLRLDPAIPLYAPYYPKYDRWYIDKFQLGDIMWNFGIGYPF
jgi:outer membrane protein assembly factor BamA